MLATFDAQAQRGAVEKAPRRIEKRRAHRRVERVDAVADDERAAFGAVGLPARLVELLKRHRRPTLLGGEAREMASELADQIAARNPDRQAEALAGCGVVDDELDRERVAMGRGDVDGVADHRAIVAAGTRRRSQARWRPCRTALHSVVSHDRHSHRACRGCTGEPRCA
jgi:hypothetical protein